MNVKPRFKVRLSDSRAPEPPTVTQGLSHHSWDASLMSKNPRDLPGPGVKVVLAGYRTLHSTLQLRQPLPPGEGVLTGRLAAALDSAQ